MKHKKIVSLLLAFVFSCSLMSFASAEPQHKDIEGHWAKETMIRAFNDGYIVGMKDGSLAPNGVINRAQVATILNQVFKNTKSVDLSGKTDIPSDAWYYNQLEKATYLGFIATYSRAIMIKNLIRQDAFVILGSAFGITEANPDESRLESFKDTDKITAIYRKAAASFVNHEIAVGADGNLMGSKNVTRAEFLTMLYKILDTRTLYDCTSEEVDLGEDGSHVVHSYELKELKAEGKYDTVSLLQQQGDVEIALESADALIIGAGGGDVHVVSGEFGAVDVTGSGRSATISTDVPKLGIAGKNNTVIIDKETTVDTLYLTDYSSENRVIVNGTVNKAVVNGKNTKFEGTGTVKDVTVNAPGVSGRVAPEDVHPLEDATIELNAPSPLPAGQALNISAKVSGLPEGDATGQWYVNGKPFGGQITVSNGNNYVCSPTVEYSKNMDTHLNAELEIIYCDGSVFEVMSKSTDVVLENYPADYYKKLDIARVNDTITSYQYQATITTNGNAYKESNLTGWLCEIQKGMKVTCLTPVNTSTVRVLLPNGNKGWVSTGAIQTGSGNYTLAKDFDNDDKVIWVNSRNYSSSTSYLIWVSLACQKVNVFTGSAGNWKLANVFPCATGAYSTPTPPGTYKISYKQSRWQYNGYWCGPVTGFYNGYAFHSWLNTNSGGAYDHTMGRPVSHGCVRMKDPDAQFMNRLPYNTTIVIY